MRERVKQKPTFFANRALKFCVGLCETWAIKETNMGFTRFVEIGRVCMVNYGPDTGKLCTIIDVVDKNKALVDGPKDVTGMPRQMIPFKRLALTDFKAKILRNARQGTLKKALAEGDVLAKWEATSWAKKRAAKVKRASMNDLDRFKLMVARKQKSRLISKSLVKIRKSA